MIADSGSGSVDKSCQDHWDIRAM